MNKDFFLYQYEDVINQAFQKGASFKLDVIGSSMSPTLKEGDSVILDKPDNIKKGDIILYKVSQTNFVMHRVLKVEEPLIVFGDNNIGIEKVNQNTFFAKVSLINKDSKQIKRNSLKYYNYFIYAKVRRFFRRVKGKLSR